MYRQVLRPLLCKTRWQALGFSTSTLILDPCQVLFCGALQAIKTTDVILIREGSALLSLGLYGSDVWTPWAESF